MQDQVLILEKQIQKAVALLGVKDEALALAEQEAAVYSAALEAFESTSNEQQGSLIPEGAGVGAQAGLRAIARQRGSRQSHRG